MVRSRTPDANARSAMTCRSRLADAHRVIWSAWRATGGLADLPTRLLQLAVFPPKLHSVDPKKSANMGFSCSILEAAAFPKIAGVTRLWDGVVLLLQGTQDVVRRSGNYVVSA